MWLATCPTLPTKEGRNRGLDPESAARGGDRARAARRVALGVVVLVDRARLPTTCPRVGSRSAYVGVAGAWGFVAAGAYAWLRRPDNRTGAADARGRALHGDGGPAVLRRRPAQRARRARRLADRRAADPPAARRSPPDGWTVRARARHRRCGVFHGHRPACPAGALRSLRRRRRETAVELAAIVATVVLLARRRRAASRVERRGLDPVLLLGAAIVALGGVFLVVQDKPTPARVPDRLRAAARGVRARARRAAASSAPPRSGG